MPERRALHCFRRGLGASEGFEDGGGPSAVGKLLGSHSLRYGPLGPGADCGSGSGGGVVAGGGSGGDARDFLLWRPVDSVMAVPDRVSVDADVQKWAEKQRDFDCRRAMVENSCLGLRLWLQGENMVGGGRGFSAGADAVGKRSVFSLVHLNIVLVANAEALAKANRSGDAGGDVGGDAEGATADPASAPPSGAAEQENFSSAPNKASFADVVSPTELTFLQSTRCLLMTADVRDALSGVIFATMFEALRNAHAHELDPAKATLRETISIAFQVLKLLRPSSTFLHGVLVVETPNHHKLFFGDVEGRSDGPVNGKVVTHFGHVTHELGESSSSSEESAVSSTDSEFEAWAHGKVSEKSLRELFRRSHFTVQRRVSIAARSYRIAVAHAVGAVRKATVSLAAAGTARWSEASSKNPPPPAVLEEFLVLRHFFCLLRLFQEDVAPTGHRLTYGARARVILEQALVSSLTALPFRNKAVVGSKKNKGINMRAARNNVVLRCSLTAPPKQTFRDLELFSIWQELPDEPAQRLLHVNMSDHGQLSFSGRAAGASTRLFEEFLVPSEGVVMDGDISQLHVAEHHHDQSGWMGMLMRIWRTTPSGGLERTVPEDVMPDMVVRSMMQSAGGGAGMFRRISCACRAGSCARLLVEDRGTTRNRAICDTVIGRRS